MNRMTCGWFTLALALAAGPAPLGCGAVANEGPDTSSHWLQKCSDHAACSEGQMCLCGVCTTGCEHTSECHAHDIDARCFAVDGCSAQAVCALESTFSSALVADDDVAPAPDPESGDASIGVGDTAAEPAADAGVGSTSNTTSTAFDDESTDVSDTFVYASSNELPTFEDAGSSVDTTEGVASAAPDFAPTSCLGEPGCPWSERAPLPYHMRGQVAVVYDGLVYLLGGAAAEFASETGGAGPQAATQAPLLVMDPNTDVWTTLSPLPTSLYVLTAHAVRDAIFVIGGYGGEGFDNKVRRYVPHSDTWDELSTMPTVRYTFVSEVVGDKIFVFGGVGPEDEPETWPAKTELEVYDTQNDAWSVATSAPQAFSAGASCVFEGRIFAFGGDNGNTTLIYDTEADTWSQGAAPLSARNGHTCVVVGDSMFLIGGRASGRELQTVERYDVAEDTWQEFEPMPTARYWFGATAIGNDVFVFGGESTANSAQHYGLLDSVEVLRVPMDG